MNRTALLCSLLIILSACHTSFKQAELKQNKLKVDHLGLSNDKKAGSRIVYLTFDVSLKDSAHDVYSFQLKNKIIAEGILKKTSFTDGSGIEPGYLYYELSTGDSSNLKNLTRFQNPLARSYEVSNENGQLSRKTFYSNKGEFTIRFQYENNVKSISIYKPEKFPTTLKKIYYAVL